MPSHGLVIGQIGGDTPLQARAQRKVARVFLGRGAPYQPHLRRSIECGCDVRPRVRCRRRTQNPDLSSRSEPRRRNSLSRCTPMNFMRFCAPVGSHLRSWFCCPSDLSVTNVIAGRSPQGAMGKPKYALHCDRVWLRGTHRQRKRTGVVTRGAPPVLQRCQPTRHGERETASCIQCCSNFGASARLRM